MRLSPPIFIAMVLMFAGLALAQPTTHPAEAMSGDLSPVAADLLPTLIDVDARVGKIRDLTADFEQRKYTAMLRKPLVSTGIAYIKGRAMRWDAKTPEATSMLLDERQAQLYYPKQGTLEVYQLDQRLGELAASPLPRLDDLRRKFTLERAELEGFTEGVPPSDYVALKLTPIDPALLQYVDHVRVLLDIKAGYIVRAEVTDADGDRTRMTFSNVKTNTGLGDLAIDVPPGTKVVRPLGSMEAGVSQAPPKAPSTSKPVRSSEDGG